MALNPEIALGVRMPQITPQIESPVARYGRLLSLRDMMQRSELAQLRADQMRRGIADEQALRALYQETPTPTAQQLYGTVSPKAATDILEARAKLQKEQAAAQLQQWDLAAKRAGRLSNRMANVLQNPTNFAWKLNLTEALREGDITQQQHDEYASLDVDLPQTRATIQSLMAATMKGKEQLDYALGSATQAADIAKARAQSAEAVTKAAVAQQTAPADVETATQKYLEQKAKTSGAQRELAAFTVPTTPEEWATWRASQAVALQPEIPKEYSPEARARIRSWAVKPQVGVTEPYPAAVQQQRLETRAAGRAAGATQNDAALADTVIANPSLYDNLTPTAKTRIAPLLADKGFTGFGKPMGDNALKQIAQTQSGIESLKDLRQVLKDNEQYIGPISGLQAMNPWSEARVAQAKIDLVKQRVGKALEGGVLRKEDEEKYKRILATLRDTPSTAVAKVDSLIAELTRDIRLFEDQQRRGGRRVPEAPSGAPAGGKRPPLSSFESK